jgi:hypothetical protein
MSALRQAGRASVNPSRLARSAPPLRGLDRLTILAALWVMIRRVMQGDIGVFGGRKA